MIKYKEKRLANGLQILVNRDRSSKLAAVNILYKVGARNESETKTGFAHLFEHLMFRGTHNVPDFDIPVQMACGENNAFTNNDYTDFYITLPKENLSTALWLESDRMRNLNISEEVCDTEKHVVIEEFKQRYLNQPYGDELLLLRDLCYKRHPYRWATIGITPEHIERATIDDVRSFYDLHYRPSQAILAISADIDEDEMIALAEEYFADIEDMGGEIAPIPTEPEQTEPRRLEVERDVPATDIQVAFHMGDRDSRDFFLGDLTSDLLAGGESSRLVNRLIKERGLFSSVNAYITGSLDAGLFIIKGRLMPETTEQEAEEALWGELRDIIEGNISEYEMEKVKNKFEANMLMGEINIMNKALNLSFYKMLGDITLINREAEIYRSLTRDEVMDFARRCFTENNSSTLIYRAKESIQ
ncbi:MAG: insulinase family protein [Rikenellaceae bacterium]|nr:insulinase family protein [Rikenellaceae bacterium]